MNEHVKPVAVRVPPCAKRLPDVLNAGPSSDEGRLAFSERYGPACEAVDDWSLKHHHVLREVMLALRPYGGGVKVLMTAGSRALHQAGTGKEVSDQVWRDLMCEALAASTARDLAEAAAGEAVRAAIWAVRRSDNPRSLYEGVENTIRFSRTAAVASADGRSDRAKENLRRLGDGLRSRVLVALAE